MTRLVEPTGRITAVTVLEAGPCPVLEVKTPADHGYGALQLGFGAAKLKNATKPLQGLFAKVGVGPQRWVREVRLAKVDGFQAGQEVRVTQFAAGDIVDVSGVNKGKGFAGGVKRHRFKGGPKTHGQSDRWRAPGSLGGQRPQKVFKGLRGPGHMGAEWTTVQRIEVVRVDGDKNLLLLKGSVPGPRGSCVTVRATTRPRRLPKVVVSVGAAKKSVKAAPKPAEKKDAGKK